MVVCCYELHVYRDLLFCIFLILKIVFKKHFKSRKLMFENTFKASPNRRTYFRFLDNSLVILMSFKQR